MPLSSIPAPQQWDSDNPNPHHLPQPPVRADGTPHAFEIVYDEAGRRMRGYSDNVSDLMEAVCGSQYADADAEQRDVLRIVRSLELAEQLQIELVAEDPDGYNALSPAEQAAVDHRRSTPCPLAEWAAELPLVLSDIHYQPHTDVPPVQSLQADEGTPPNIIWLRPADEWDFLVSLDAAGFLAVNTRG
jgi:hypothetical protein